MKELDAKESPRITANAAKGEEESLSEIATAVPTDNEPNAMQNYLDRLRFMNEEVEVFFPPSTDKNDTTRLYEFFVNGKAYFFLRGVWTKTRRFVAEAAARAKRESWDFSYTRAADGSTRQTEFAVQSLRRPFQVRDKNPEGGAWLQQALERKV